MAAFNGKCSATKPLPPSPRPFLFGFGLVFSFLFFLFFLLQASGEGEFVLRESLTLLLFVCHGHDFSPLEILPRAQFTQVCQIEGMVSLSCYFYFFYFLINS